MEPVSIALICALSFGVVVAFSVFVRQLLLSRDKSLNDKAQQRALGQEAEELAKIRAEMKNSKSRFEAHYQIMASNKEAIKYLDDKINDILKKKEDLVHRYAQITLQESSAIVKGEQDPERKLKCDRLQAEIDAEIDFYQKEILYYQKRRDSLWDSHRELLDHLTSQEDIRNGNMDKLYKKHSSMLQKIFIRHNENSEKIASETIQAGTKSFKSMIMSPILFLMQYFGLGKGLDLEKMKDELKSRQDVSDSESEINEPVDDTVNEPEVNSDVESDVDPSDTDSVNSDDLDSWPEEDMDNDYVKLKGRALAME